jgi:hypothetical protein
LSAEHDTPLWRVALRSVKKDVARLDDKTRRNEFDSIDSKGTLSLFVCWAMEPRHDRGVQYSGSLKAIMRMISCFVTPGTQS